MRKKPSPRFIGSYKVLERVDPVAYRLALPPELVGLHDIFNVSQLRQYIHDPTHIINYPLVDLRKNLSCDEYPWKIVDRQENSLRNRSIPCMKVLWANHSEREAT